MSDIIFYQSAPGIFARCQAVVAACDFDFPSFVGLLGVFALVFSQVASPVYSEMEASRFLENTYFLSLSLH